MDKIGFFSDGGWFDRYFWKINLINFILSLSVFIVSDNFFLNLGYYRMFDYPYPVDGLIVFWFIMSFFISLPFAIVGFAKKCNNYERISLENEI